MLLLTVATSITTRADTATEPPQFACVTEQLREFKGGEQALLAFIAMNLQWPVQHRDGCTSGRVLVGFTISDEGKVGDIKILKTGLPKAFSNEAIRVVSLLPRFIPGRQCGKAVAAQYVLPIRFCLM